MKCGKCHYYCKCSGICTLCGQYLLLDKERMCQSCRSTLLQSKIELALKQWTCPRCKKVRKVQQRAEYYLCSCGNTFCFKCSSSGVDRSTHFLWDCAAKAEFQEGKCINCEVKCEFVADMGCGHLCMYCVLDRARCSQCGKA